MGDFKTMFYQVKVAEEDKDFLHFLWWPEGNVSQKIEEYCMAVQLFGTISSPSCANYALRRTAETIMLTSHQRFWKQSEETFMLMTV